MTEQMKRRGFLASVAALACAPIGMLFGKAGNVAVRKLVATETTDFDKQTFQRTFLVRTNGTEGPSEVLAAEKIPRIRSSIKGFENLSVDSVQAYPTDSPTEWEVVANYVEKRGTA